MKIHSLAASSGLLIALALSSGCETAGHQRAESTAMHMEDMRAAVVALKEKVSAVPTSFAKVVEQAEVDPKPSFEQYKKSVSAMKAGLDRAESQMKSMKDQGQTYFAEWQKQSATLSDPDLKQRALERREKLSKAVAAVSDAMTAAQAVIAPFTKTSADLQVCLNNDLTSAGIKSVADKSKQVAKDASSIGKQLDDVIQALQRVAPHVKTAD